MVDLRREMLDVRFEMVMSLKTKAYMRLMVNGCAKGIPLGMANSLVD